MEFPAEIGSLREMIAFVTSFLDKKTVDKQAVMRIELAVEEALVNIISYAFPNKTDHEKIKVECQNSDRTLVVMIEDKGGAFNPLEAQICPDIDKPPSERKIGGLGIFLMQKLSDMHYERKDDKNLLRLTFHY